MEYRKLGRTKLKVSSIGIGGGAFVGKEKTVQLINDVVKFAVSKGVNLIETAEDYGEEKIYPAIKEIRNKLIVVSKSFSSTKNEMKKSIENSLKKLHTKKIEIYMMHTVDSIESLNFRIKNGALEALKEAREEEKIDWIGITTHNILTAIEAVKTNEFDVIEVPYCVGTHETEKLFEYTKNYDVGIIAMRPFGGGILLDRSKKNKVMNVRNTLGYVLSNKNIACALVGMSSIEHVKENVDAVNSLQLCKIDRKKVEKEVEKILGKNFCRGCLACMPCEKHGWKFPIDQFMRMWVYYFKYKIDSAIEEYKRASFNNKCLYCKKCEEKCPYKVPITQNLKSLESIAGKT